MGLEVAGDCVLLAGMERLEAVTGLERRGVDG